MNKIRRLAGTKKLKSRHITIDNDNLDGDDHQYFENAQDADNRTISGLGTSLRTKKRRERVSSLNEAIIHMRKASSQNSELSDMQLY